MEVISETGTCGEVIYGCDESTIRNAAKKYAEQLGPLFYADECRGGLYL